MERSLKLPFAAAAATLLLLGGCSSGTGEPQQSASVSEQEGEHGGMAEMDHGSSGEVPDGLRDAANPAYPVGTPITLHTDHMPGMKGAKGTVAGAYDTTVYSVSYTPTDGGEPVVDHKWVIREELKTADGEAPEAGDAVTIEADHMQGMQGASATVDTAREGVVYMLDYMPTDGGEAVKNHKWVTEDELSAD